jgi:hypothetical protein
VCACYLSAVSLNIGPDISFEYMLGWKGMWRKQGKAYVTSDEISY